MLSHYYSSESAENLLARKETFVVVEFGNRCAPSATPGLIQTGVSSLPVETQREVWCIEDSPVRRGVTGRCHWSESKDLLCTAIWLNPEQCKDLAGETKAAYVELLEFVQSTDFPHPFRFWNYIPHINRGEGDDEEYKKFCAGRLGAFSHMDIPSKHFPAASALGHQSEGAVIYVFSSMNKGIQHENPRQQKAYQYPRQYGISSPSFSRATSLELGKQSRFFISGTASILGYETTYLNEFKGQLTTTLDNIEQLLQNKPDYCNLQSLKVYLRDNTHYDDARKLISERFPRVATLYTHADVCRQNLLVEIEAHS